MTENRTRQDDLLRSGLKQSVTMPKNTFTQDQLGNRKPKKPKEEPKTSVRMNASTSDALTALRTIFGYVSVNEMLDDVIYEKVAKLDASQREIYKASLKISELRRKRK